MQLRPSRLAAPLVVVAALLMALMAAPASAAVVNGQERLTIADPFPVRVTAPGVPTPDQGIFRGSGFPPGQQVYVQVCDGTAPSSSTDYVVGEHCADANAGTVVQANGDVVIDTAQASFQFDGPFHGEDPVSHLFNCLAPGDDPNGPTTAVGDQPIDPQLPSWGSSRGPSRAGGGPEPCQLRFSTDPSTYQPSDIYLALTGFGPATTSGSSGTALLIALPIVVLALAGGLLAWRRRARRPAARTAAPSAGSNPAARPSNARGTPLTRPRLSLLLSLTTQLLRHGGARKEQTP